MTVDDIASRVAIPKPDLLHIAELGPRLYRERHQPKKSGGQRLIEEPRPNLKALQRQLLDKVFHQIPMHQMLHGGPSSTTKQAASIHLRQPVVIAMDIQDFFPSVTSGMVKKMFVKNGFSDEAAKVLSRLITRSNHLPQGAPTSSCVGRLVLTPFAYQLEKLLETIPHAVASIWVDDLIISGPKGLWRAKATIIGMLKRHGFRINPAKIKLMKRSEEQVALGIRVNERIEASSEYMSKLNEASKTLPPFHQRLQGMRAYVKNLQN